MSYPSCYSKVSGSEVGDDAEGEPLREKANDVNVMLDLLIVNGRATHLLTITDIHVHM